ncbi:MAG: class I SAM-dependent methyltransferase [Methylocystaceae bacterium]|nr:class I SAM-dependent methyltransferase [Methylocystaceae bacterium]
MNKIVTCPYCSSSHKPRNTKDASLLACSECDVVFPKELKNADQSQAILDDQYDLVYSTDVSVQWNFASIIPELDILHKIAPHIFNNGRSLDIGSGDGTFVAGLKNKGSNASGIEAYAVLSKQAQTAGADVRHGRYDTKNLSKEFSDESFELISFRECLYYVDSLKETLDLTHRRLTDTGILYIKGNLLDSPYYWSQNNLRVRYGAMATYMFTYPTLKKILKKHGFEIIHHIKSPLSFEHFCEALNLPKAPNIICKMMQIVMRFLPPDRHLIFAQKIK